MLAPADRVIMISGAGRGIGRAIAKNLAAAGYRLSLGVRDVARYRDELEALAPGRVLVAAFDAGRRETFAPWVEATVARFGRIDGLVNNAGIGRQVTVMEGDEADLDAMWQVNCKAPLFLTRLAMPHLAASGAGRIVNVASLSGKRVRNDNVGYAMSKFAVMALTHATRQYGWDKGVRTTAVCPSFVATDMTADVTNVRRHDMIDPADLAVAVATVLALPNNAAVAELLVNCRCEDML